MAVDPGTAGVGAGLVRELGPGRGGALSLQAQAHQLAVDPPLLGGVLPRYVRFMAKREIFKFPFGLMVTTAYGAFPVRRNEVDRQALRRAEDILAQGGVVGMFPEGHRSHGKGLLPAFDGATLVARRSGFTRRHIHPTRFSRRSLARGLAAAGFGEISVNVTTTRLAITAWCTTF